MAAGFPKTVTKEFSPDTYARCNHRAMIAVAAHLVFCGLFVRWPREDFRADIRAGRETRDCIDEANSLITLDFQRHEAEIKEVWEYGARWPAAWDTVDIPGRKWKLKQDRTALFFWIVSNDLTHAWCVDGHRITSKHKGVKWNKAVGAEEEFMRVPTSVKWCKLIKLERMVK